MPSSSIAREMEKQKKRRGEEIKTGSFCWVKLEEESAEEMEDLLERYRSRTKTKADLKIMLRDQDVHLNANKCVPSVFSSWLFFFSSCWKTNTGMTQTCTHLD